MKGLFLFSFLALMTALAICFPSCSFLEESPVLQTSENLACYSSILLCRAGLSSSCNVRIKTLDIFAYDTTEAGTLDSYEHLDIPDPDSFGLNPELLEISSSSGGKNVVIVANMNLARHSYKDVVTYRQFSSLLSSLYDEDISCPVFIGESCFHAGPETRQELTLYPLSSRIRIRSFEVDFSGRSYSEYTLEDIRAYLVNVNASCRYLHSNEQSAAVDFINFHHLDEECVASMKSPEILLQNGPDLSGCCLFCYPCAKGDDENWNPTMLVIEGVIEGEKYYYPLIIGDGIILPAADYVFDIKITRKGVTSPDRTIEAEDVGIQFYIEKWKEYAWETVDY